MGYNDNNEPIYLSDVWPSNSEISEVLSLCLKKEMFIGRYKDVFAGPNNWKKIKAEVGLTYKWDLTSTYIRYPPYFDNIKKEIEII